MRKRERRSKQLFWLAALAMLAMGRPALRARGGNMQRPGRLTLDDLRRLAASVGFVGASVDIAAAVAMAESDGYPDAQGDPRGPFGPTPNGSSSSFGLWQINRPAHPHYDPARLLQDPRYNAQAAYEVSAGGTNWTPWTMYRNGRYLAFMPGGANA